MTKHFSQAAAAAAGAALIAAAGLSASPVGARMTAAPAIGGHPVPARPHVPAIHRTLTARRLTNTAPRSIFVAGGATLPALGYMGNVFSGKFASKPAPTSVFGYFGTTLSGHHETIQYCQTGSGYGKKVFNGDANVANPPQSFGQEAVNLPCPSGVATPAPGVNGFQAPQTGSGFPVSDPDITGSDAPLSQSEYSDFVTNKHQNLSTIQIDRGEPVQVPYIVGAVAIMYHNANATTRLNLSAAQICGIIKGTITNWSAFGLPSKPIKLVYRADGSGTTFSFSNYLVRQGCTGLNVSQVFTGGSGVVVESSPPAGSVGASGNSGVTNCIVSSSNCPNGMGGGDGSIGYVEAANALGARSGNTINFATVNNRDPIRNLPEAANAVAASSLLTDEVINTPGGPASPAPLSPPPATPGCLLAVNPAGYNAIGTGYPILAISNLELAFLNNGAQNAADLRILAQELTNGSIVFANHRKIGESAPDSSPINVTTVDAATSTAGTGTTGYATLGAGFAAPIGSQVSKCVNT
jgi:phosphate transport system substrate-binding protein